MGYFEISELIKLTSAQFTRISANLQELRRLDNIDVRVENLRDYDFNFIEDLNSHNPEIAMTHRHIGQIYGRLENVEKAIAHFERSLDI